MLNNIYVNLNKLTEIKNIILFKLVRQISNFCLVYVKKLNRH